MPDDPLPVQIDTGSLTSLLQTVFSKEHLEIERWEAELLFSGFEFTSRVFRLSGTAVDEGHLFAWSIILKVIQPDLEAKDSEGFHYWKRDALAYQSGVLSDLPGRIASPHCYEMSTQADGSIWLFFEDVKDESDAVWSLEQYSQAARSLGEFNGAYLAGCSLPEADWITHDWLRKYLEHARPMVDFIRHNHDHPLVKGLFPGNSLAQALALWDMHPVLLQRLDELPQTFCHQDAFQRNLFLRNGQMVAIDWGYAGIAPVGAELAPLVAAGFLLSNFPASQAKDLDKTCFRAYMEGLRAAGWHPDEKQVRLGYTVTTILRYVLAATVGEQIPALMDPEKRDYLLISQEKSNTEIEKTDPQVADYFYGLLFEMFKLLGFRFVLQLLGRSLMYMIRLRRKAQPSVG